MTKEMISQPEELMPNEQEPRGMTEEEFDILTTKSVFNSLTGTVARITGNFHEAEDRVQDAYIRALRHRGKFKGDAKPETWMHRITINVAQSSMIKAWRKKEFLVDPSDLFHLESTLPPPEDTVVILEEARKVASAWSRLPDSSRELLSLVVSGLSHKQIAEHNQEQDTTENAVKIRVHRARKELKSLLEEPTKE